MPLFWLSLAFLIGLVLGTGFALPWWGWLGAAALFTCLAFFERRLFSRFPTYIRLHGLLRLPLGLVLAALLLGGLRQELTRQPLTPADLAWYNSQSDQTFRLTGVVSADPSPGLKTTLQVEARSITPLQNGTAAGQTQTVSGRLLAVTASGQSFRYGDLVELEGSLSSLDNSQEGQASQGALARQGVQTILYFPQLKLVQHDAGSPLLGLLYNMRQQARRTINEILPAPESALLSGILLGISSDLPDAAVGAFQATGTAHIWAISGFNIAIVSGLLITLFGRLLPRRRLAASLIAIGVITAYTLLVGANPSVVRAAIMGTVGMFGPLLGRRQVGVNSLTFTAAVMCLFDPGLPWSISFQLSFMATLGLVLFGDPLQQGLERLLARRLSPAWAQRAAGPVCEYFLLTLAAQVMTLPITAIHFQRVSLSAVLANPLVLPVQSLVMVLGGLALVGGLIFIPLGQALAALAWPLLAYTMRVVELLARLPGGVMIGTMDQAVGLACYAALGALALGLYQSAFFKRWLRPAALIIGAALLAGAGWRAAMAAPDGLLHLSAFNVNGLPAVLIQAQDGQFILVNGGAETTRLADELGRRLQTFDPHLDAWLVTSRSTSPLAAAQVLIDRYPPSKATFSSYLPTGKARDQALAALKEAGVELHTFQNGQGIDLANGAQVQVLADTNDGTALLVEWQSFSVLIPGGVKIKDLRALPLDGITALVLGPADLETQAAADWSALAPAVVLWQRSGTLIDLPGWLSLESCDWIELSSDGASLWTEIGKN